MDIRILWALESLKCSEKHEVSKKKTLSAI